MPEEEATEQLAAFTAGLTFDDIPLGVREFSKNLLLDTFACALAGYEGEELLQVTALADALGGSDENNVIGGGRSSLAGATITNSYLVTAMAMCDVHRATMMHVSPQVIPSALAIAEREGCSGRELIVAIVAGAEAALRIAVGLDYPAFRSKGWHTPGVVGPFGAAAAAGKLLRFDAETMARAFGLAASRSSGTFAALGTAAFKFHQFCGALSGLMAALTAQQGFAAPRNVLTAPDGGIYSTYSNGGRPELVTADLGKRWQIEQIGLRPWPLASTLQGMATALFELIEKHGTAANDVNVVRVALSKPSFDLHAGFARYETKMEALFSTHYAAAIIMHDRTLALAQFEPARYKDPSLRSFAATQVEVAMGVELKGAEAKIEVVTVDGTIHRAHCMHPKGSPENPVSREDIEAKFGAYAKARMSPSQIADIPTMVAKLEDFPTVAKLIDMLRS